MCARTMSHATKTDQYPYSVKRGSREVYRVVMHSHCSKVQSLCGERWQSGNVLLGRDHALEPIPRDVSESGHADLMILARTS